MDLQIPQFVKVGLVQSVCQTENSGQLGDDNPLLCGEPGEISVFLGGQIVSNAACYESCFQNFTLPQAKNIHTFN